MATGDWGTPFHVLLRKAQSARTRFRQFAEAQQFINRERAKAKAFRKWVGRLSADPPDVLVGSNFAEYGGVRHHIHSLKEYSSLKVELAPSDELVALVPPHEIRTRFRDDFLRFKPAGIRSIHSHVFPWFIEWCDQNRSTSRWVHTYHLPYFPEHARGELEPWQEEINQYQTQVACRADVRISVSKWQQEYLKRAHDIDTVYLPNGVDADKCDKADATRFRSTFGVGEFLLYVGRNDPVKDPAAFIQLAMEMPSRQFVMIGRGLTREMINAEFTPTPHNLLALGELSHDATLDAIRACSVVVVTSKREGLPTLVLEAMCLGRTVVVPDEAGSLEAVDNGRFGFIYKLGDIASLTRTTMEALSDAPHAAAARERIMDEYSWQLVARKLDAIYRDGKE